MKNKSWPNESLKYIKNVEYKDKQLKTEIQQKSKLKYENYKLGKYIDKDLICINYNPKESQQKVKIKSLVNFPDHPAHPYFGLFSNTNILPKSLILKYVGFVTKDDDFDKNSDYVLNLLNEYNIDANKMGNESRYINDYRNISNQPNCEFREFFDLNTQELAMGIFALNSTIKPNQEILINYGKAFWKNR